MIVLSHLSLTHSLKDVWHLSIQVFLGYLAIRMDPNTISMYSVISYPVDSHVTNFLRIKSQKAHDDVLDPSVKTLIMGRVGYSERSA